MLVLASAEERDSLMISMALHYIIIIVLLGHFVCCREDKIKSMAAFTLKMLLSPQGAAHINMRADPPPNHHPIHRLGRMS